MSFQSKNQKKEEPVPSFNTLRNNKKSAVTFNHDVVNFESSQNMILDSEPVLDEEPNNGFNAMTEDTSQNATSFTPNLRRFATLRKKLST